MMVKLSKKNSKQTAMYKYLANVRNAKLDNGDKSLLRFYAETYNWAENKPSRYAERTICALEGITVNTLIKRRKSLERLGWVTVQYKGPHTPCNVWVNIGEDDEKYNSASYAKWHPSNRVEIEEEYPEHDPFRNEEVA